MNYYDRSLDALMHAYGRYNVTFDHGDGIHLYDVNQKEYIDFFSGIGVNSFGYNYPAYVEAMEKQLHRLMHISNYFNTVETIEAAECVKKATKLDKVFFTNSGTEAIEGAIKLARKYAYNKDKNSKGEIIAMNHSFHGRSMGALSVTGTKHYREPFEPLIGGVSFANYNDLESVKKLATKDTCAVILETLQGEGGIYPATDEFIHGLRKFCDENDILLIFDEIQCGMGRTGKMFTYQHYGVKPDIMTSAKALGCGVPVGAFAATKEVADAMCPGDHGTTYGGNPLATAAVCKVFEIFEKDGILNHVNEIAPYLKDKLNVLKDKFPDKIKDVRGKGLMMGMELYGPAGDVVSELLKKGVILISAGTNIIRFVPPLVVEKEHIDVMCEKLEEVFSTNE